MSDVKKAPKTIEVKVLVPYAIIAFMVTAVAFTIVGWAITMNQQNYIKSEAANMVTSLSPKVQK